MEYLGTTQIVTVETPSGRVQGAPSRRYRRRESASRLASHFEPEKLSLFDKSSGRAIRTERTLAIQKRETVMAEIVFENVTKSFGSTAKR